MSSSALDAYFEALTVAARTANTAELEHQRQAARRAAELKAERAFAWRRLNLVRAVAVAVRPAEDPEAAAAAGSAALLREVDWSGPSESRQAVVDRFSPVVQAVWATGRPEGSEVAPAAALAAFEAWYAAERGAPFLGLMEREIVELPLVEI